MKARECDGCKEMKVHTSGWIEIDYHNPELGTDKSANICWDCQEKTLKEILHKVVIND